MDHIPFTKVSIDEAKAALATNIGPVRILPQVTKQWETKRGPQHAAIQDLEAQTFKWLATLPKEARPNSLAIQFPRIANRLAEVWKRRLQCERYLDDLMIDRRGGRQGFPSDVAADIAKLKDHFLSSRSSVGVDIWANRS